MYVLHPHGGRTWIKTLSVCCVTIKFVACAPSTDKLLLWAYPKGDCRLAFVDSGALGRGCAYSSPDEQDGHRSSFYGRGWRSQVQRRAAHLDNSWRRPYDHDSGRNPDPIWDSRGVDFDHVDSENPTSAPSLQGKARRQIGSSPSPRPRRPQGSRSLQPGGFDFT